jgi:hypothetical protein
MRNGSDRYFDRFRNLLLILNLSKVVIHHDCIHIEVITLQLYHTGCHSNSIPLRRIPSTLVFRIVQKFSKNFRNFQKFSEISGLFLYALLRLDREHIWNTQHRWVVVTDVMPHNVVFWKRDARDPDCDEYVVIKRSLNRDYNTR